MADISKIKLPSGTTYDLKDAWARSQISALSEAMVFCGETTTSLSDGATTKPITLKAAVKIRGVDYAAGASYTPVAGDVFVYNRLEFAFNGTSWIELGDLNLSSDFGALAFANSVSALYTPEGSISGKFTYGTAITVSSSGSVTGTVSAPTISVSAAGSTATAKVAPAAATTVLSGLTDGTAPSCTLPTLSTSVQNETLTLSWTDGSFSAGSMPTAKTFTLSSATFKTGDATYSASQPSLTNATASVTGTIAANTITGNISDTSFTGLSATITSTKKD